MRNSYQKGTRAESLATFLLRLKGYRILEKRFKTPLGEIDLIAKKGKTVVFIEVKRRGTLEEGFYAIRLPQQKRIERAALLYLQRRKKFQHLGIRFDVMVMMPWRVKHLKNAWQANRS